MTENHQTSNKQGHNEASLNANNSELQGKSSQLIQKFDKMSTKKIDSMAISSKQENLSTDNFNMIIDEINDFIHKLKNKGIGWKLEKQKVIEYFNDHKINLQESYHWLLNNQISSNSIFILGCEIGVQKDYNKAFILFKQSAERGFSGGVMMLGYCYDKGIGITVDKQKAFELYQNAANLGDHVAQKNLVLMYEKRKRNYKRHE
ncbi:kinase-like domain-containing protein [Rhizophagus clarus]|uniref:Kinase-like domain-containing protein n=1 Tax=Rhizophagus clarus TaxID=94130 RepID=A0A8H3MHT2_9GLOM|nr:kinase-like domain-containing protein [Rhizophagus clarus]